MPAHEILPARKSRPRPRAGPRAVAPADLARDVLAGLSAQPKRLPSRWFYDARGSALFTRITGLPEYYLTACEREIFERHKEDLARRLGPEPFRFVELGPGDGRKTMILLRHFLAARLDFTYAPIDISEAALRDLVAALGATLPALDVRGVVGDFVDGARRLRDDDRRGTFVLFGGSNIGNFEASEALAFLRALRKALRAGDRLLVGFDLKKEIDVMRRAYDDAQGVTAAFNLNLLHRINRELAGEFDPGKFRFYSTYDVVDGAIHSYLVSRERQSVRIGALGRTFSFLAWEPIWTECSYKYLPDQIERLARRSGFAVEAELYDERRWFVDSLWRAR